MFPFTSKNLIGIDIGSYSVKVVSFSGKPGSYSLKTAACFKLPREGGQPVPATPGLLAEIVKSQKLKGSRAATLLTGSSLVFRHIYLPKMPEKDLKEAVRWEIRKETSIPPEEIVADYTLSNGSKEENRLSLIAFAARKGDIEKIMSMFREADIDLRVVEAVPTALLASFDLNNSWEDGINYGVLDIGDSKSTLAIFKNKKLAFAREIPSAGQRFTTALAEGLRIDEAEAEELKIAYGLNMPEKETAAKGILASAIEGLCAELHRSFNFYQAQFREGSVQKLFLSGGTARLKGIEGFITEAVGIPCFADDPFRGVKIPQNMDKQTISAMAPCLTIAAGLASRNP